MQSVKELKSVYSFGPYKAYLVKVRRYQLDYPKKSRGDKSAYILYVTMKEPITEDDKLVSFGSRIKTYKWAKKAFDNICACMRAADLNAANIEPLWDMMCSLPEKAYINKDYVPTFYMVAKELGIITEQN